ncbi:MAG TPA: M56 family metallopeptidase [Bryobacteraceae bacterium]|jgi:TonB family protein
MLDYAIRSTLLLTVTAAAAWTLRNRSAAWRHLVWLAGLIALLALPAAKAVAPHWTAPMMTESMLAAPVRTVINVTASRASRGSRGIEIVEWTIAVWMIGAAFLVVRLWRAQVMAKRLARRAAAGPIPRVFVSSETRVPIVCGLWNPVVVLPTDSSDWPAGRLESVLRHERMHIARRDTVSQALAQLACALYWPQPLVWLAASALRKSCEQACDDGVLSQGAKPSAYAEHLMEIARALAPSGTEAVLEGGIAMTRTNLLEERISALLNPQRDRRQAGAGFAATVAALAVTVVIGLAAIRTPLFAQSGKFTGIVHDPSGAVLPNRARVDIRASAAAGNKAPYHEIVYSNGAGEFSLDNVPDGVYDISITAPGFAKQEHQGVLVDSSKGKPMEITLAMGVIQERMQVKGEGTPASAFAPKTTTSPTRIRVGGNVQAANLTHKVTPLYPTDAKLDGIEGTVIMKAVIGKDGTILSLEQINKQVDPRLAQVAIEAVKQWQYRPTLLNGEPVEVVTEIEVNFTLSR